MQLFFCFGKRIEIPQIFIISKTRAKYSRDRRKTTNKQTKKKPANKHNLNLNKYELVISILKIYFMGVAVLHKKRKAFSHQWLVL